MAPVCGSASPVATDLLVAVPESHAPSLLRLHAPCKRERLVELNTLALEHLLQMAPCTLNCELFDSEICSAELDQVEFRPGETGFIRRGHIAGHPGSSILLACKNKTVAATIRLPGKGIYHIESAGGGLHRLIQLDLDQYPVCGQGAGQLFPSPTSTLEPAVLSGILPVSEANVSPLASSRDDVQRGVSVVKLMVAYTDKARVAAGGVDAIEAQIDLEFAEVGECLRNSRINVQIDLVYKAETIFEDAPGARIEGALARLIAPDDGYMDEVMQWREQYQADLVSLVVENTDGPGGQAISPHTPSMDLRNSAFASVIVRRYMPGSFLLAHELGHNFGCMHDWDNSGPGGGYPILPFAHGYRFSVGTNLFRTVMAYPPGEPVPYFSNPDVLYEGEPTGFPNGSGSGADNARAMNQLGPVVAAYRGPSMNDYFENRIPLSAPAVYAFSSNLDATREPGEPNHAGFPGTNSIWWSWVAPRSERFTVVASGWDQVDSDLAVYTGGSVSNLTPVASSRDGPGPYWPGADVTFDAVVGVEYQIAVDGNYETGPGNRITGCIMLSIFPEAVQIIDLTTAIHRKHHQMLFRVAGGGGFYTAMIIESTRTMTRWIQSPYYQNFGGQFDYLETNTLRRDRQFFRIQKQTF